MQQRQQQNWQELQEVRKELAAQVATIAAAQADCNTAHTAPMRILLDVRGVHTTCRMGEVVQKQAVFRPRSLFF